MSHQPFIKRIETNRGIYIYDVNSNELIRVNRLTADILADPDLDDDEMFRKYSGCYSLQEIQQSLTRIREAKNLGFFSSDKPEIVNGFESEQSMRLAVVAKPGRTTSGSERRGRIPSGIVFYPDSV